MTALGGMGIQFFTEKIPNRTLKNQYTKEKSEETSLQKFPCFISITNEHKERRLPQEISS